MKIIRSCIIKGNRAILIFLLLAGQQSVVNAQQLDSLKSKKPFSIHGNAGINFIGYNVSGIQERMAPFTMMLSAHAVASVYGISIPFSFRYSGKKADYLQPFNQFGLSPQYKWVTLHGGYRNVHFSNFTLAGHTFLGAGVELNPGKFRFGYVYGRFRDNNDNVAFGADTLRNYTRRGFAMRIGTGSDKNFVDFILMRIQDDSTSLDQPLRPFSSMAEQNGIIGINSRVSLSRNLFLESEVAASFFTTDMSAPGFESMKEVPGWTSIDGLMVINQSSELLSAVRSSLNYRKKSTAVRLEYRRIDPGYRSMGAYFFNNDVEQITLAPSFMMLKRKLHVRGSIGIQQDNLRKSKGATTTRAISSFGVSYNPLPIFGIDLNYSNYSNNQRPGRLPLIDSLKQFHTTANLSIMPRLIIVREKCQHMIMLVFNRMELNDKNAQTALYTENRALTWQVNYHLNISKHGITCMAGINHNRLQNYIAEYKATGFTLGIAKNFFEGKLSTGWNNVFLNTNTAMQKGWVYNSTVNALYQYNHHHTLRFNFYIINASYKDEAATPSFHEIKGDFGYAYTF